MRNEENIGHVVRSKRLITMLPLNYDTFCQFINYQVKQEKHKLLLLINNSSIIN